jgi:DNA-binding NtrC family response regulator
MMSYLDCYLESVKGKPALPTLRDLEKDYIGFLLELTSHNVTQVSRILAISRTALYQKINRYYNVPGPN